MTVRNSLVWSYGSQYLGFVLQFGLTVIMARLLTPHEMGVFSVAVGATLVLQAVQGLSLSQYIVQQRELDPDKLSLVWTLLLLSGFVTSASLYLAAGPLADFYREPALHDLFVVLAISNFVGLLSAVPGALLLREMRFRSLFTVNVVPLAIGAVVGVSCALNGMGPFSLAWMTLAQSAARSIISALYRPQACRFKLRLKGLGPVLRFGVSITAVNVVTSLSARLPELVFGRTLGMAPVGLYGRAASITEQAYRLVTQGASPVMFSDFARRRRDNHELVSAYVKVHACFTALCWPAFVLLALTAEPLIERLFGSAWASAAPLLQLLCVSQILYSAVLMNFELPIIFDRIKLLIWAETLHFGIGTALLVGLAVFGDLMLATMSRVGQGFIFVAIHLTVAASLLHFRIRQFVRIYAQSAAISLLTAVPIIWLRLSSDENFQSASWTTLAFIYTCAAAVWIVGIAALRHPLWDELCKWSRQYAR